LLPVKLFLVAAFPRFFQGPSLNKLSVSLSLGLTGFMSSYFCQSLIYSAFKGMHVVGNNLVLLILGSIAIDFVLFRFGGRWQVTPSLTFAAVINAVTAGYGLTSAAHYASMQPLAMAGIWLSMFCGMFVFECLNLFPSWRYRLEIAGISGLSSILVSIVFPL